MADRWYSHKILRDDNGHPILDAAGKEQRVPTSRNGKGFRWQARFVTREGREVAKSFAKKAEANRWLAAQTADVTRGEYISNDRQAVTVGSVAETWKARVEQLKPSTRAGYLNRWKVRVEPRWGKIRLAAVEHADVVQWIAELRQAGLSVSSISACHGVLSQILQIAVKDGRLLRNPCHDVALPSAAHAEHQDHRIISLTELQKLAQEADGGSESQNGSMVLTLGLVGLRFGELAGLRVENVDLDRRTLRIVRNVTEVDGHLHIGSPKNGRPRTVNFPRALADRLLTQITDRPQGAYLFPQGGVEAFGESKPIRRANWTKRVFTPAVERAGLQPLHPHDLRHCYAAAAISAGANVMVVQRQLGHSRASITLDIYADLFGDDLSSAADRLDAVLSGPQ